MKLRNKKTDEIVNAWSFYDDNKTINLKYFTDGGQVNLEYYSLTELCEDWEDVKEPLIKDPKIRKAVRAWAEANDIDEIVCYVVENGFEFAGNATRLDIRFNQMLEINTNRRYTITELCGEEAIKDEG